MGRTRFPLKPMINQAEILIALVVAAHAGAAFYHHYFQRDTTLTRMLPRRSSPRADNNLPR